MIDIVWNLFESVKEIFNLLDKKMIVNGLATASIIATISFLLKRTDLTSGSKLPRRNIEWVLDIIGLIIALPALICFILMHVLKILPTSAFNPFIISEIFEISSLANFFAVGYGLILVVFIWGQIRQILERQASISFLISSLARLVFFPSIIILILFILKVSWESSFGGHTIKEINQLNIDYRYYLVILGQLMIYSGSILFFSSLLELLFGKPHLTDPNKISTDSIQ